MREIITEVKFTKETKNQFGILYQFAISYDGKTAYYSSKSKDQKKFIPGEEAEFTEEERAYTNKNGNPDSYLVIKPIYPNRQSNFGRALSKEQARYSAMCVSYAKDLVIGGRIQIGELPDYAWIMFELIKEMDKSLNS